MKPEAVEADCFVCGLVQGAVRYAVLDGPWRVIGAVTVVHCTRGCDPSWHVELDGVGYELNELVQRLQARGLELDTPRLARGSRGR